MRVVVALSGGVDSSVAAALLLEQGYEVVGMTLRLYNCEDGQNEKSCCGLAGVSTARAAAGTLGIPHYVIDGQSLFEERVLKSAWKEYASGRTPNPCVACNEWLKFGLLFEQAAKLDAEFVATGHHARMTRDADGNAILLRGHDPRKDQTYFLFSLNREQLNRSLLPIGDLTKDQVREIARAHHLPNADRLESQDACIAQKSDLAEALRVRFNGEAKTGPIVDLDGKMIGIHQGIHRVTIGQRKGIGVALGDRAYVVAINPERNEVVVGRDADALLATGLEASNIRWHLNGILESNEPTPDFSLEGEVQIRYRHQAVPATITALPNRRAVIHFAEPQRAVTPGQAVVFYQGDRCLGGGWIDCALRTEPRIALSPTTLEPQLAL